MRKVRVETYMRNNSNGNPAASGSIVERIKAFLNGKDYYEVREMPSRTAGNIKMELADLKRLCKGESLPLFCLKVQSRPPLSNLFVDMIPSKTWFTLSNNFCFYSYEERLKNDAVQQGVN
jgi:hypothetical protein